MKVFSSNQTQLHAAADQFQTEHSQTDQPVYEEFTLAAGGLVLLAIIVIVGMGIGLKNRFR